MDEIIFSKIPKEMRYRSHPWHGLPLGSEAPDKINCYIEMVSTDAVKYEMDKDTGLMKVDRPQKFSSLCPTLYGFLPQTYSGERTAKFCMEKTGRDDLVGDADPVDICILTERTIVKGDIVVSAIPIGGFRMLDGDEVDDKLIGVMVDDYVYGEFRDVSHCPSQLIERLRHYFLTYKEIPNKERPLVTIETIFGADEAKEIIELSRLDYRDFLRAKIEELS